MDKVRKCNESDENIARAIFDKVGEGGAISYATVAKEATKYGT